MKLPQPPTVRAGALRSAGGSDPGRVRDNNEDRFHVDAERGIFMVIDGLGGHAGGEQAAEIALGQVRARLERLTGTLEQRIREAITVANNEIHHRARRNPELSGMACVLTVAVIENGFATIGHVGDSRLFKLRKGAIEKITHDHSPVGEREDRGELSEEHAMRHPRRNEVFRDVGSEEHTPLDESFIELIRIPFEADSALLLCTDGLSDAVPSATIAAIVLRNAADERRVVRSLIGAANDAGGKDNVTVVFAAGERFADSWADGKMRVGAGFMGADDATAQPLSRVDPGLRGLAANRWVLLFFGFVIGMVSLALLERYAPTSWIAGGQGLTQNLERPRILRVGPHGRYRSITEALEAAKEGDSLLVAPGVYPEQVRLREGVTILAEEPRRSVLAPPREAARSGPGAPGGRPGTLSVRGPVAVVADRLGSARIAGFEIAGSAAAPVEVGILLNDAAVEVSDMEISGTDVAAIEIGGARAPTIRSSFFHDNKGVGILMGRGSSCRISHNFLLGTPGSGAPGLVDLQPGARAILLGNVIVGAPREAVRGDLTAAQREAIAAENLFVSGIAALPRALRGNGSSDALRLGDGGSGTPRAGGQRQGPRPGSPLRGTGEP